MDRSTLSVIEARWFRNGNDSVRPLFETIASIIYANPHSIRYDMFVEKISLKKLLEDISNKKSHDSIYIAAHGDEKNIYGLNGNRISRTELKNIIKKYNTRGIINGLYLGSCSVGNNNNSKFWLNDTTKLKWVAGYKNEVDWIDSSAIDMIFWAKFLHKKKNNNSSSQNTSNIYLIKESSREIKEIMPNLNEKFGFNVYYKEENGSINSVW